MMKQHKKQGVIMFITKHIAVLGLVVYSSFVSADVSLPNGTVNEYVEDMRVEAFGGPVVIDRQYMEGRWEVNSRWKPAVYSGIPNTTGSCVAYPAIEVRERVYEGNGTAWTLENRYTIRAKDYFAGADCEANRIKTLRWQDRSTGQWMEFERADNTQLQYQLVRYGDRNNNTITLDYDTASQPDLANLTAGKVKYVRDNNNNILYTFTYTGNNLTQIQDNPSIIPGNTATPRSVQYAYTSTTYKGQTYQTINQVTDVLGNITKYGINNGNLTSIKDAESTADNPRIRTYTYSADRVVKYTDALGNETTYKYDYDRNKQEFYVRVDSPPPTPSATEHLITESWYSKEGNIIRRDFNGKTDFVKSDIDSVTRSYVVTNAKGSRVQFTEDEYGNTIKTVYADGSNSQAAYSSIHGGLLTYTDELGVKTQNEYDTKGNLVKVTEALGLPEQRVTEYVLNDKGQILSATEKGSDIVLPDNSTVSTADATWQFEYDDFGNIVTAINPEGDTTTFVYDIQGLLVESTNPLGNKKEYQRNAIGSVTQITNALGHINTYEYDNVDNLTAYTDAKGNTAYRSYDANNHLIERVNRVNGKYKLSYNTQGLPISETDEDGRFSEARFDSLMRINEVIDGLGNKTTYQYPASGSTTGSQLGAKPEAIQYPTYKVEYQYGIKQEVTKETLQNPFGESTESTVSDGVYNALQQLISFKDAYGKTQNYTYDGHGQLIEIKDSLGNATKAAYDTRGNLLALMDANGNLTLFEYDKEDRLIKQTLPLGQTETYSYDAAGNVVERIDASSNKVTYTYDAGERLVEVQRYNAGDLLQSTATFTWDADNNITAWTDTDHTQAVGQQTTSAHLTYDDEGRKLSETVTIPTPTGDAYTLSYSYTYSVAGYKTRLTLADSTPIDYTYTAHGQLESVSIPGEGLISVNQFDWTAPKKVLLPGGLTQDYTYDGLLNTKELKVRTPGQQTVLNLNNDYGKLQELKQTSRVDSNSTGSSQLNAEYDYDSETRLLEVRTNTGGLLSDQVEGFTLDAVGNRVAHTKSSGDWLYDGNNRLTQRGSGSDLVAYQYDNVGNLIQKTTGTGTSAQVVNYRYDTQNRLILVEQVDSTQTSTAPIARYGYDLQDRRIWKEQYREVNNQLLPQAIRTYYLYSDEGLIAESVQPITYNESSSIDSAVAVSQAVESPVISVQYGPKPDSNFSTGILFIKTKDSNDQDQYAYYQHNQLQTPLQATDKNGNIVWSANYNAFGEAQITTPAPSDASGYEQVTSNLRFPGQYYDEETGLHYNYRRYYDASTGRYLTQDPLGIDGGVNLYGYAFSDPINLTDPRGECPICVAIAACFASCMAQELVLQEVTGVCADWAFATGVCGVACTTVAGGLAKLAITAKRINDARKAKQAAKAAKAAKEKAEAAVKAAKEKAEAATRKNRFPDRKLPRDERTANPKPDAEAEGPYTQLGQRTGKDGRKYDQGREFDGDGRPVRDIDFTDHGRPSQHPNPHQHRYKPNPTGGTQQRGKPEPL